MIASVMILAIMLAAVLGLFAFAELRYLAGLRAVDRAWRNEQPGKLKNVGTTRSLSILPLVDWFTARTRLRGEAGVSYLIKTDQATILMDVGLNLTGSDPSPLLHNMHELGVTLADFDTIAISHLHADHVGGLRWVTRKTFSLGNEQLNLAAKRVFAPVPMSYPGLRLHCSSEPTVVAPGVATIGSIPEQLFMGQVNEQALAINVEGKGIILVVGCGHQSVPKILARSEQLFDEPIYGIVGGLHYPIPHGRLLQFGMDLQRFLVYGPFHVPNRQKIEADINLLVRHNPQWVSLSAHDSSDEVIDEFRRTFAERYHDLSVGEWLQIAGGIPGMGAA